MYQIKQNITVRMVRLTRVRLKIFAEGEIKLILYDVLFSATKHLVASEDWDSRYID